MLAQRAGEMVMRAAVGTQERIWSHLEQWAHGRGDGHMVER